MLKSYFKLAYRNLLKNKISSFINIFGLSVAIGCSIIFFLLLDLEYTSDRFHENAKNTFLVGYQLEGEEGGQRWGDSPLPLGPALKAKFPQIIDAVRIMDRSVTLRYKDKVFNESIRFAEPGFLDMFTFPLKSGDKLQTTDKNGLILSEKSALKFFGQENPIGKELVITFTKNRKATFFVKGVAKKFPLNSSFNFTLLASFDKLFDIGMSDKDDWGQLINATFIQVDNPTAVSTLPAQMLQYVQSHNAARIDRPISSFILEPLPTLSWESQKIRRIISSGSTTEALILLFVIGLFLLVQACVNYVNISLASATQRFKEIGIRKVAGSRRSQLIKQFLGEILLLCFLALLVGFYITEFVLLPGFFEIAGSADKISLFDFFKNIHMLSFFAVLLFVTGIGAGLYPALIISGVQPVTVLKGKLKLGGKKRFTSILLSFQFGITFTIICLVITFMQNNRYQMERDWGYNQEHVLSVELEDGEQFEMIKNVAAQDPNVIQTAGSVHTFGKAQGQAVVVVVGNKYEVIRFDVGINYLETLGIRLREGRFFKEEMSSDQDAALVVNAQFVQKMGWQNGIDQTVRYENKLYNVIGIVENFHYLSFYEKIEPVMIRVVPEKNFRYLAVRTFAGTGVQSANLLRSKWQGLFPDSPATVFFQDSVFENAFRNNVTITKIFTATAIITLIISCMGFFGLVTLMISKRTKELGIHKILGASTGQVAKLISKRFIFLIIISSLLPVPGGYYFLTALLDGIYNDYHVAVGVFPFVAAALIIMLTAFVTIVTHVYKASSSNPINALRYE